MSEKHQAKKERWLQKIARTALGGPPQIGKESSTAYKNLKWSEGIVGFTNIHVGDTVTWAANDDLTLYDIVVAIQKNRGISTEMGATFKLGIKVKISCPKSPGH